MRMDLDFEVRTTDDSPFPARRPLRSPTILILLRYLRLALLLGASLAVAGALRRAAEGAPARVDQAGGASSRGWRSCKVWGGRHSGSLQAWK